MSDAKPRTSFRSYWHTLVKKRADPIEDGSEVQQGHFHPPSHGAVRGCYRSYSSQPASSSLSSRSHGSVDKSTEGMGIERRITMAKTALVSDKLYDLPIPIDLHISKQG
ncbi:hypothetical protein ZWY2020_025564 [Hordeum vulgare]|nr:hypothetical protein ZWY2020_025564 [Hordeum vulgare]